jgi:hypothetical protein
MEIGNLFINVREVCYFTVQEITSVDIRIFIYFKNGTHTWTRTNDDQINRLKNYLCNL